jgi:seryl-tRNA synthetase
METLAVIAWKYPVLQADVVKIRHNKAYDHLRQLEELGFIMRVKFGRTNKLTLTQKFFEYFDLPTKEQAKEVFKNIVPEKIKEKVENTEKEIDVAERKLEERKKKKKELEEKQKAKAEEKQTASEATTEIKEELKEIQEKEDKEINEIEKDIKEIQKEEDKNVYATVPEVQAPDEVSKHDN